LICRNLPPGIALHDILIVNCGKGIGLSYMLDEVHIKGEKHAN